MKSKKLCFDLDGVIYQSDRLIDGSKHTISALDNANIPYRFITNTSRMTKNNLISSLKKMGFIIAPENILSAPHAAIEYCKMMGFEKISLIVSDSDMKKDFLCFELVDKNPEAIILGDMGFAFNFELLNNVFNAIMNGSKLIAMHKNRFWLTGSGLQMDLGAFVSALEYAAGQRAVIMGKPDPNIFMLAAKEWNCPNNTIYMVGDDIEVDVGGAQNAGMKSVLVRTGKFRQNILDNSKIKPDFIIDSISELPRLFNLN